MTHSEPGTTIIDRTGGHITLINTFTVAADKQQTFIETQHGEYKRLKGQIPGATAANLHRGRSGRRAIKYAQFHRLDEFMAWRTSDLMKAHRLVIDPFVERAAPRLFRVVHAVERAAGAAKIVEGGEAVIAIMSVDPAAALDVLAHQRDAAEHIVRTIPGVRAMVLHRGTASAGPGSGPEAAAGAPPEATVALYAVVDGEPAARALLDDAGYRAAFTTEDARIRELDVDSYTVYAVAPA